MELLIVLAVGAVAVGVYFFLKNKEETAVDKAAPYKVEAPEKTETVTVHTVAGLAVTDTVPVVVDKPAKKVKQPARPRKKKAV